MYSLYAHKKGHDCKHSKAYVINRTRNRVTSCKVLTYRYAPKPEYKTKFCYQNEAESGTTHAKPTVWCRRYPQTTNYPSCCGKDDGNHDGCFHQLGHSRPNTRHEPKQADRSKNEACSEYEGKIQYSSFQYIHGVAQSRCFSGDTAAQDLICMAITSPLWI